MSGLLRSVKNHKAWICYECGTKNPPQELLCHGCDMGKSRARVPRAVVEVRDVERDPWASFDTDGDGVLTHSEFEKLYSLLRKTHPGDSQSVFNFFDDDRSGFIDYDEFNRNVKNPPPPKTEFTDIMFIKDAISVLNGPNSDDDFFDADELKRCAEIALSDPTERSQFTSMVDRHTLSNGNIDVDDFISKAGVL